ncbi:MAG: gp26 family baseplate hub assembly chaperone [Patescibacteria group bacterium]|nr:gp26 family baseplate hub assembly chaperone [Patescibacteria group bacterium]
MPNFFEKYAEHPVVKVELPISKNIVWIRPYLVKEQKILLTIAESTDISEIGKNLQALALACTVSSEEKDMEKVVKGLSMIDLQYLIVKLREISVGNDVEQVYICRNKVNKSGVCGGELVIKYKLSDIEIDVPETPYKDNCVYFTEKAGVKLMLPRIFDGMKGNYDTPEEVLLMIANHIEFFFDEDGIYKEGVEKYVEYMQNMKLEDFKKIVEFFSEETLPKLKLTVPYTCPKCGFEGRVVLENLTDFFTF